MKLAPFADVHYFADAQYWRWNKDAEFFKNFEGERITIEPTGMQVEDGSIHMLRNGGVEGLSTESLGIANGRNSGYQAVNIAVLAGGNPIILLGYDMRHANGKDHFPGGEHPIPTPEQNLKDYAKNFRTMKPNVPVLNATPGSLIDAFPRVNLEEALCSH